MADYATVQVKRTTKRLLEAARKPGETFDAVVRRTLKQAQAGEEREFFDDLETIFADRKSFKPLR